MAACLEILTTEDLQDFVDGRSGPEESEAILDLMSEDPLVSQFVYDYRRQNLAMKRAFAAPDDDGARFLAGIIAEATAGPARSGRRSGPSGD